MLGKATFLGLSGLTAIFVVLVLLAIFVFEIAMLVSVINSKHLNQNEKILWVLGMFLLHPIVAIFYYFTEHKKDSV